ncbi:MAG: lysophospholipase L1-like esterase [Lachnospiraceae bacterium]|nr:lysophospholipase L1-like esterase [Lachnospiraceae bacterium]
MEDCMIQISQRNSDNTGWINLFPVAKAAGVINNDGTTAEYKLINLEKKSMDIDYRNAINIEDNFNRANTDTLTILTTGDSWNNILGSFGIADNMAVPKTFSNSTSRAEVETYRSDFTMSSDFSYAGNGEVLSFLFRSDGTVKNNRMGVYIDGSTVSLKKYIKDVSTVIDSVNYTCPTNTTVKVKIIANNNNFKVYLNDVLYIDKTDDNILKPLTMAGFQVYKSNSLASSKIDNFKLTAEASSYWSNTSFLTLGDSITAANTYQPIIKKKLSFDSYTNLGVNGETMADANNSAGNIGVVTTGLSVNDYNKYNLIIISAGTNDFRFSVNIGTIGTIADTTFDRSTFYGAYRTLVEYILSKNPYARIILVTPLQRNKEGYNTNFTNSAGLKLIDYANAVKKIGEMYGIPVCDLYNNSGFTEKTMDTYTIDGVHPNSAGSLRIGEYMSRFIYSIGL